MALREYSLMQIRLLTPDDAEAFWHLRLQDLRNDPASFADSAEEHLTTRVETARDRRRKGAFADNFIVGMFEEGKLSGTAGFYRYMHNKERHKGHIWGVYVRPESRGKGVGSALMKEIIRRARELNGLEQITLVASAKLPAQRLYKALGFESYGIEPHSLKIGNEYVDDVLMVLWL
jgi:ribosomal protein S18 acetylase RimI-like enzyme